MAQEKVIAAIRAIMQNNQRFVIAGHTNPDGDAVGACFGLALALAKRQKDVSVVLEPPALRYGVVPGRHLLYTGRLEALAADVLFCLDSADPGRLGDARILLDRFPCVVCVDHHITNKGYARYNYIDSAASSTSEMVYRLVREEAARDRSIAAALYAGIVSDTNGFLYGTECRETMEAAARLVATGIPHTDIYMEILHLRTVTELRLLGRVLEAFRVRCGGKLVYACVTDEMLANINARNDDHAGGVLRATSQDLEGVVEYLLNVRGAEASLLVYPKANGEIKISMRSRNIDVGRIATVLGGGGHTHAAGCNRYGDMAAITDEVLLLLEQAVCSYA